MRTWRILKPLDQIYSICIWIRLNPKMWYLWYVNLWKFDVAKVKKRVLFFEIISFYIKNFWNSELDNIRIRGLNVIFVGMLVFRRKSEIRQMLPKTRQLCREILNPFYSCPSRQIRVGLNFYESRKASRRTNW